MDESKRVTPYVRHEADYMRELNRIVAERALSARTDPLAQHLAWTCGQQDRRVLAIDPAKAKLPSDVRRFVGDAEARALQELVSEVVALNARFVGEPLVEVNVQVNGTPEQHDLIARSLEWARRYVARRLARPNNRDQGCPYRRFVRLWSELVPIIDELGLVASSSGELEAASVVGQYLGPMCDFITWSFFERTWISDVIWSEEQASASIAERPDVDLVARTMCLQVFGVYG